MRDLSVQFEPENVKARSTCPVHGLAVWGTPAERYAFLLAHSACLADRPRAVRPKSRRN